MSSGCVSFSGDCPQATGQQAPRSLPQYALFGFLFIFVMAAFIVIFLIRTRNLCLDAQRRRGLRLGSNRMETAVAESAGGTLTVVPVSSPAEPLIRSGQGLDPGVVQALPLFSYKKGGIPESAGLKGIGDCSVCLSGYQEGQSVRLLPGCKHFFHPECVDKWLVSHTSCPLCRTDVQVKKQSSLKRVLSLLGGRNQVEDSDARDGSTPTSDGHTVLSVVPEFVVAAPIPISGQLVPPPAPPSLEESISQTAVEAASTGEVRVSVSHEGRANSSEVDSEQADKQSSSILGNRRNRRPGSEDIRWAVTDASGLETTTPRPVKRAASLGRDHVSLRQRPFFERRHSFTEMLRKSITRDPSLGRSLSRPTDPQSSAFLTADTRQHHLDMEQGPPPLQVVPR